MGGKETITGKCMESRESKGRRWVYTVVGIERALEYAGLTGHGFEANYLPYPPVLIT